MRGADIWSDVWIPIQTYHVDAGLVIAPSKYYYATKYCCTILRQLHAVIIMIVHFPKIYYFHIEAR